MSGEVDILMFHSIADGPGPVSIRPPVFERQMATIEQCGRHGVSLGDYASWRRGELDLDGEFVVLTFDDGYDDFAMTAYPRIRERGWGCTVFLPTGLVGERADAAPLGAAMGSRLMDWSTVERLAAAGVEFGAHGVSHRDLTRLSAAETRQEIADSKSAIEARIGRSVEAFAPPFGRTNRALRAQVQELYTCAAGTRMARATSHSGLIDLPRIEMWYFRDTRRWRRYLERGPTLYFRQRQVLRAVRRLTTRTPGGEV